MVPSLLRIQPDLPVVYSQISLCKAVRIHLFVLKNTWHIKCAGELKLKVASSGAFEGLAAAVEKFSDPNLVQWALATLLAVSEVSGTKALLESLALLSFTFSSRRKGGHEERGHVRGRPASCSQASQTLAGPATSHCGCSRVLLPQQW
jgi:hypothetical protein